MAKDTKSNKTKIADGEYKRLVDLYKSANVDEVKLKINDSLIRKVAELYAILESMKDLPTILFNPKNPNDQKETAAGKARVKYMAQYTASMQKLNKDLLGALVVDDDELADFDGE
ncbi:hypothetical protein [Helicobacter rodentium]|uniref:hypothetical protein n=1 Tax=Helicobacter rodentium TaxID=59617 RepID=UPI00262D20AF|nr:hypothetical protein [Helicobacter rodentium]